MKWLITGGCGFIGVNLIKSLLKVQDYSLRVLDNLSVGTQENLASVCGSGVDNIELIVGDILDEQLALKVTKDIDVIVHLAANTGVVPSVQDPRAKIV